MKTCQKVASVVVLPVLFGCILLTIISSFTDHLYSNAIKPLTSDRIERILYYESNSKFNLHHDFQSPEFQKYLSIWRTVSPSVEDADHLITMPAVPPLVQNGGMVTLDWSNLREHYPDSLNKTWIGLYCPSHSSHFNVIDFWWIKDMVKNQHTDTSAKFTLYNVRTDCQYRFFLSDTTITKLIAVSNKIHFIDSQKAHLHIHLALTGHPSEMRVQWTTGKSCVPTVHYGISPDNLVFMATGISSTYTASDMCGPPANMSENFISPGYLHDVLLTDLTPNTKYYYQVSGTGISSEVMSFIAPPPPGSDQPFTFAVYGDMDITVHAEQTAAHVLSDIKTGALFILHIGDLAYSTGFAYRWDEWMTLIEPLSSRAPYMVSIGNHEQCSQGESKKDPSGESFHPAWGNYGHDSGGECGVPVVKRFHMPDNGNSVWWYSFKHGLAYIIQLSTEHDLSPGSEQYVWLKRELESVDRKSTPWLIITGHRPLYNSEAYPSDLNVSLHLRAGIEELMYKYSVDLFVAGHFHSYERTCRVYKEKCVQDGIAHVTVGSAGMSLDDALLWDFDWSKHFEFSYGYGRITVFSRAELLWEFVRVQDGIVSDYVTLVK